MSNTLYKFTAMGRVLRSATLLTVLLLPTLGAGYCALMHDSCSQGNMSGLAVGMADCCLSCFDAALTETTIKSPIRIYAPDHHGVQAWLPISVNLDMTFRISTFHPDIGFDTGPPISPPPLSVLRI
jgi:hypothetical protein